MRNFVAVLMAAAIVSVASASMTVKMGVAPGGHPYLATVMTGPVAGNNVGETLDVFCLEKNEQFKKNHVYNVQLGMSSKNGGVAGGNPDPLDIRTAWVYANYLDGNLAGFTAKNVQNVIWHIEQEINYNKLKSAEKNLLAMADAGGAAWGTNYHGVQVMNLEKNGKQYQSQVIRAIPVPGAALLGLLGLSAIARFRK